MGEKAYEYLDVIGVLLIVIAIVLFICYSTFGDFEGLFLGMIFGIVGIVLVKLSEKIKIQSAILCTMLLVISAITSILNISKVLSGIIIIICGAGILLFVFNPSDDKKELVQDSTVKQ